MDYRQIVRERATSLGLDPNLAEALVHQESGGNPNAVSPAGAVGLMQLMPGTAKELGVDPRVPEQNIDGGLRYLKKQIEQYGVAGGLAAYNAGPGRVQRAGLTYDNLPEETRKYVPAIMNRAAMIAEQKGAAMTVGQEPSGAPSGPSLDLPTLMGGLEKARDANDTEAVSEIAGAIQSKFKAALSKAQAAGDAEAVQEIQGSMAAFGGPQATTPAPRVSKAPVEAPRGLPEAPKDAPKGVMRQVDDFVRGAADTLTFGYADEIAAKLDSLVGGGQSGKTNYGEALKAQRGRDKEGGYERLAGQFAGGLAPAGVAIQASKGATKLARAGAGAATGAIQGGLYGTGTAEGDLESRLKEGVKGAAIGGVAGGALSAILPVTRAQQGNRLIREAGNDGVARLDAEIIQDIAAVAKNPNQRGNPVTAVQLNAVENRYIKDVEQLLGDLPKEIAKPVRGALQNRRALDPEEISGLRNLGPAGEAAAVAIEKAQRARSMTQAMQSSGGLLPLMREGVDFLPVPAAVHRGLKAFLGGRQTREVAAQKVLSRADAAADVLARLGPSGHGDALRKLQDSVGQTQAVRATARADGEAAKLAKEAAKKQDVLNKAREEVVRRQSQVNIQNAGRASDARAAEIGQAQREAQRLAEQSRAAEMARLQTTQRASRSNMESAQRASASRADEVVQQQSMAERLAAEAQAAERARAQTTAQASRANQQSAQAASAARASEVSQKSALETALENARNATTARQSATNLTNAQTGVASRADEIAQQLAAEQARSSTTASQGALNARKTPQVSPMANADEAAKEAARAATTKAQSAKNAQAAKQHVSKVLGERNQKMIEEGVKAIQEGRLVGEMSRNAGGFSASVKHIDADQEDIFKTLQAIARDNPEYAPEVARMFTPGASTEKIYVLQNMVMDRLGVGRRAVDGALSAAVSGKGNPVSSAIYNMSDDRVAGLLGRTKDTLDQPIASAKAYLTTRASRALETLNKGGKLADEDLVLLKALGFDK